MQNLATCLCELYLLNWLANTTVTIAIANRFKAIHVKTIQSMVKTLI